MQRADLLAKLNAAIDGLTYPSESDEPFDVVYWENPNKTPLQALIAEKAANSRKVKTVPVDEFFTQLLEADAAPQFQILRRTIQSVARNIQVFRVGEGEVRVDVYVIGQTNPDQSVVGVHTLSVET